MKKNGKGVRDYIERPTIAFYILYVIYNFIYSNVLTIFVQLSSQYGPFLKYYIIYYFYNLVYNFIMYTMSVYA